ncbi:MAG: hypothetical protein WD266_03185 [Balneolales bacterium]
MNKLLPIKSLTAAVLAVLLLGGCTVRYVADYDETIRDEIYEIAADVDHFWGFMAEFPQDERRYVGFRGDYVEIETKLRILLMKSEARQDNKLSSDQARIVLELWVEDRELHREEDDFSDFLINRHRRQFNEVFTAMARAEETKRMND